MVLLSSGVGDCRRVQYQISLRPLATRCTKIETGGRLAAYPTRPP